MPVATPSRFWSLVDRISFAWIGVLAAAGILVPAILYWIISVPGSENYIGQTGAPDHNFIDAAYFSFVTLASFGYGDIIPFGWARLLACVQVIYGLLLAGLAVAKLTATRSKDMRYASRMAVGDWIEPCRMPDGRCMVTFSIIYESGDGLAYDGENFDSAGEPLGFFQSVLIDSSKYHLRFRYSNRDSSIEYFGEGITSHRFTTDPNSGVWNRNHTTCRDFDHGITLQYEGYRASEEQSKIIHGSDLEARRFLVKVYIKLLARI